eukprot:CAMPEP_0170567904 /NCGR_PEP_ID=MMETSP0211-20121228/80785_1 /TAXON_ID=311385 /ORGANISM="Pseudokeronopsis sp., Strain OXSARD2" /LENGTH=66 /DNA_ID=CAMNT_0010889505 /DNA_START=1510 /DNA_END=1711 /DNA_ORIENTATION=-
MENQIDKRSRNDDERIEAEELLEEVKVMDYETMFMKQKKDGGIRKERGIMKALKEEHEQDLKLEEK